jgi:hypothetical protein
MRINLSDVHNEVTELRELGSLERLCEEIRHHFSGRTMFDIHLTGLDAVGEKKIPDIDVTRSLTAGPTPIPLQQHSALIVLVHGVLLCFVALSLQKIASPQDLRHYVVDTDDFRFGRTLRVQALRF